MSSSTIYLITGANRGIGLGLVTELVSTRPDALVFAGARKPESATALQEVQKQYPDRVQIVKLASGDVEGNKAVAKEIVEKNYGRLDVVIANAAIANYMGTALETPPEVMSEHFKVNVNGVLVLFQTMHSLLKASSSPKFIPISSGVGSIATFSSLKLGYSAYGASKAALNYLTRKIHFENEWLVSFPLSPGVVTTDASMLNRRLDKTGLLATMQDQTLISVEEASKSLVTLIENATREENGGEFMHYDGTQLAW